MAAASSVDGLIVGLKRAGHRVKKGEEESPGHGSRTRQYRPELGGAGVQTWCLGRVKSHFGQPERGLTGRC